MEPPVKNRGTSMRIASVGHAVFAATMVALGILGLTQRNFAPIWDSVPKGLPAREALAYLCAVISLACGLGLLWRRTAVTAARVLFVYLLLWLLAFKVRFIFTGPLVEGSYQSCGETAVMVAGAWALYARFAADGDRQRLGFAVGDNGVRLARVLYGLALIAFGLSHFVYLNLTAPAVPAWLPGHTFWAYFSGAAYIAAGAAVIFDVCARLAATLSAVEMGMLTLLVWIPIVAAGSADPSQWSETVLSWALTAAGWVVAESYRGTPWLARRGSA
jgi:uncharacterized membrane protein